MKRFLITAILSGVALMPSVMSAADTDAVLRLRDECKRHPRVCSVSFPGDTRWREAYDAVYSHGAIVENPYAAFRIYMNESQAVDLYLKPSPCMEAAASGFYATPSHISAGGGRDVLKVGKSLGLGSFRGYADGVAVTVDSVAERGQRIVADDAVEVVDRGWMFNGHAVDMVQRYSVRPDSPDLFVEITLSGHEPGDLFCTGVQKLDSCNTGGCDASGRVYSRGMNVPDGKHPEFVEAVALELEANPENVVAVAEDELNYLVILRPGADGKIRYRARARFAE